MNKLNFKLLTKRDRAKYSVTNYMNSARLRFYCLHIFLACYQVVGVGKMNSLFPIEVESVLHVQIVECTSHLYSIWNNIIALHFPLNLFQD